MNENITHEEIRNALLILQQVCKAQECECNECPLIYKGLCMGELAPCEWEINAIDRWRAFK